MFLILMLYSLKMFLDIDECDRAGSNACEFGCINQEPGYQCTCPTGYQLAANGFDCDRECYTSVLNI